MLLVTCTSGASKAAMQQQGQAGIRMVLQEQTVFAVGALAGALAAGCLLALCHQKWQVTLSQLALLPPANPRTVMFQAGIAGAIMLFVEQSGDL